MHIIFVIKASLQTYKSSCDWHVFNFVFMILLRNLIMRKIFNTLKYARTTQRPIVLHVSFMRRLTRGSECLGVSEFECEACNRSIRKIGSEAEKLVIFLSKDYLSFYLPPIRTRLSFGKFLFGLIILTL